MSVDCVGNLASKVGETSIEVDLYNLTLSVDQILLVRVVESCVDITVDFIGWAFLLLSYFYFLYT